MRADEAAAFCVFTCACGATKTEAIAALGHSWNSGSVTTNATCVATGVKTYTYDELSTINGTLANTVYNWKVNTYTKAPTMYGSQLFLVYKNAETKNLEKSNLTPNLVTNPFFSNVSKCE